MVCLGADLEAIYDTDRVTLHLTNNELPVLLLADAAVGLRNGDPGSKVGTGVPELSCWAEVYDDSMKAAAEPVSRARCRRESVAVDGRAVVD